MKKVGPNIEHAAIPTRLIAMWSEHGKAILCFAIAVMAFYTLLSFGHQFWRLLVDQGFLGAIDLKARHREVGWFFHGRDVKTVYPPASFAILWPLVGWVTLDTARWLWALIYLVMLVWFSSLLVRESTANKRVEIIFVALCLLSMNGTGLTIGSGQLGLIILPLLVTGLILIRDNHEALLGRDILAALLIIAALVKPTISAPFFWIALFIGKPRPALLIVLGYLLLTIYSASFQEGRTVEQFDDWLNRSSKLGVTPGEGSTNLYNMIPNGNNMSVQLPFSKISLGINNIRISLIALLLLGVWIYFHRRADFWILMGVTGIFSRLWTYHRIYDDILIILPMIALFKLMKEGSLTIKEGLAAGILLGANIFVNFIPARVQHRWPAPWPELYSCAHFAVWILMLVFFVYLALKQVRRNVSDNITPAGAF